MRGAYDGRKILRNSARCLLCGNEIESKDRHDFRSCSCGNVSVDGGQSYIRRVFKTLNFVNTSIYDVDLGFQNRQEFGENLPSIGWHEACILALDDVDLDEQTRQRLQQLHSDEIERIKNGGGAYER